MSKRPRSTSIRTAWRMNSVIEPSLPPFPSGGLNDPHTHSSTHHLQYEGVVTMEDEERWNTVQFRPAKLQPPPSGGRGAARHNGAAAAEATTAPPAASGVRIRGGPGVVFSSSHGFVTVTVDAPAPAWIPGGGGFGGGGGGEQQVRTCRVGASMWPHATSCTSMHLHVARCGPMRPHVAFSNPARIVELMGHPLTMNLAPPPPPPPPPIRCRCHGAATPLSGALPVLLWSS